VGGPPGGFAIGVGENIRPTPWNVGPFLQNRVRFRFGALLFKKGFFLPVTRAHCNGVHARPPTAPTSYDLFENIRLF